MLLSWRWRESPSRSSLAIDVVGVKRRLVLLGPPASGKGTQADLIKYRFGIPTTSTGAILRKQAKERTPLGLEAEQIISKGGLALALSVDAIRARMALRLVCANCGKVVSMGRHVQSSHDPCPNCSGPLEKRSDDNNEALERRLEAYWEKTVPVYKYYGNRLVEIDAGRDVKVVFADIAGLIAE